MSYLINVLEWSPESGLNRQPALYKSAAPPAIASASGRIRTDDLHFTKVLLYQLSYAGSGCGGQVYH